MFLSVNAVMRLFTFVAKDDHGCGDWGKWITFVVVKILNINLVELNFSFLHSTQLPKCLYTTYV